MNKKLQNITRKNTKTISLIILSITGIILILLSYLSNKDTNEKYESTSEQDIYKARLEQKLTDTLNSITSGNCVNVMITLEGGFEKVYAVSSYTEKESLFGQKEQSEMPLLKTKNPKIAGVMIVCSNIFDAQSVLEIKKAAATCLNINENKIYIIGGTISQ